MTSSFSSKLAAKSYDLEQQIRTQSTIDWQKISIYQILRSWELSVIIRLYQRLIKKNRDIDSWVSKLKHSSNPQKEIHDWLQDDKLIPSIANYIFDQTNDLKDFLWAFHGVTRKDYIWAATIVEFSQKITELFDAKNSEIFWLIKPLDKRVFNKYDKYLDSCTMALYRGYHVFPWWKRNPDLNIWAGKLAEMKWKIS
jgi:hypothetical protein